MCPRTAACVGCKSKAHKQEVTGGLQVFWISVTGFFCSGNSVPLFRHTHWPRDQQHFKTKHNWLVWGSWRASMARLKSLRDLWCLGVNQTKFYGCVMDRTQFNLSQLRLWYAKCLCMIFHSSISTYSCTRKDQTDEEIDEVSCRGFWNAKVKG